MLVDSVVSGLNSAINLGALVNLMVAAVSVFPDLDLVGIVGGIDPAVDSVLAATVVNPSVKLMGTAFNIEVVKNFMGVSIVSPRSNGLSLTGNAWNFRDLGLSASFRSSWSFTSKRRDSVRKRGVLAGNRVATSCSQEKGKCEEGFHLVD